jgi:hypothetical protein
LFSIFRKKIERKNGTDDIGKFIIKFVNSLYNFDRVGLHILFLKCDGTKFPRNAYANALEVYCSTYFYGPIVIAFGQNNTPFKLQNFIPRALIDVIQPLNEEE